MEDIVDRLTHLAEVNEHALSSWELEFVESLQVLDRSGLTDKQKEKIAEITKKLEDL